MSEFYKLMEKMQKELQRIKKSGTPEKHWKKYEDEFLKFKKKIENI